MRKMGKILGLAALASLGACAPMMQMGPQFEVRSGNCAAPQRAALHRTQVMATQQKINAIQARYTMGARMAPVNPQSWKRIASGECQ